MNILVTGCAGFIGSHFVDKALEKGHTVVGVDSLTYAGKLSNMDSFRNEISFYQFDICDTEAIEKIVASNDIEWIVNFAAESHVDNSIKSCDEFVRTNILGVKSLLDVCRSTSSKMLQISTDEVYGSIKSGSFTESDILNPRNPYSATKAAAEHLVTSYSNTYGVDYIIVRPSNNFGPRQHSEKLLPTVLESLKNNRKIPIYGNGTNVRDWLYVKNTANIVEKILSSKNINTICNITNSNEFKNIEIVKKITSFLDKDFKSNIVFVKDRAGHDFRYSISNKKLKELNCYAESDFNNDLHETIGAYYE